MLFQLTITGATLPADMGKRKPAPGPRKLTTYFGPAGVRSAKDGASWEHPHSPSHHSTLCGSNSSGGTRSSPRDSPGNSPLKSNPKKSPAHQYAGEKGRGDISEDSTREFIECIDDYPAVGQPLLDKTLKDMLVSLRGSLHRDMMSMVS